MKKNINFKYLIIILLIGLYPHFTMASSVCVETSSEIVSEREVIILDVKIDTKGESINTVEGDINLNPSDLFLVKDFSLAGSALSLWPRTPSLSNDGKTISFVGGVPGGFKSNNAILFKIILLLSKA